MTKQTPAAAARIAARREALARDFTPALILRATQGLTLARYAQAFYAGARRDTELELDDALALYMNRGAKTDAHENAWLDGNTHSDEYAEDALRMILEDREEEDERLRVKAAQEARAVFAEGLERRRAARKAGRS